MQNIEPCESDFFSVSALNYDNQAIEQFARTINEKGIVEIPGAFNSWVIESARTYLARAGESIQSDYFTLRSSDMSPCVLTEISESKALRTFLDRLLIASQLPVPKDKTVHHVVRSITGETNSQASNKYHFDAYALTVAMPIVIPDEPDTNCGDFVLFLRRRRYNTNVITNLVYKAIFQSSLFQRLATTQVFHKHLEGRTIKTRPGNMYVFYGFQTYHGNEDINPRLHRATALFHYADPFEGSTLIKGIEKRRKRPQLKSSHTE